MVDQILTLKEVAAYLKLAEKTAYRLASEGKLPGFKVGGSWRFKRDDLEVWIDENKKWVSTYKEIIGNLTVIIYYDINHLNIDNFPIGT